MFTKAPDQPRKLRESGSENRGVTSETPRLEGPIRNRSLGPAPASTVNNDELISAAESILLPKRRNGRLFGDVGAAILSSSDRLFLGVSVDTPSWGLCAESCALAPMIAAGEYSFRKAVAVWKNPTTQLLHILPPCGVCREFMRSIDDGNLDSEIILGRDRSLRLRELLPAHEWPEPLTDSQLTKS